MVVDIWDHSRSSYTPLVLKSPIRLRDVAPGQVVFMYESMADGFGGQEVRETYYRRLEGEVGKNVLRQRLGVAQGDVGSRPRYAVILNRPCTDPPSSHGDLPVYGIAASAFWKDYSRVLDVQRAGN